MLFRCSQGQYPGPARTGNLIVLWLEMARDSVLGGGSWGFGLSLFFPTQKRKGGRSPYWELVPRVRAGDSVLHLRGVKPHARLVGFSTAETAGFETSERPPDPGKWGYADRFYRVLLGDFVALPGPVQPENIFRQQERALREYLDGNSKRSQAARRRIFFVVQGGRLQCQNGAYLSEVDDGLAGILLGSDYSRGTDVDRPPMIDAPTGEAIRLVRAREGQRSFSDRVRANYGRRCSFPGCDVVEDRFLAGVHIARWSDEPELRGKLWKGLCLCLMHDWAFERGFFTIAEDLSVAVIRQSAQVAGSRWCQQHLFPYGGQSILSGQVPPDRRALRHHWSRIGFAPAS